MNTEDNLENRTSENRKFDSSLGSDVRWLCRMKTVSVSIDEATWQAAAQVAELQQTTVDALVSDFLKDVAARRDGLERPEERAAARKELVKALRECGAVVGEKPSREKTYSDR